MGGEAGGGRRCGEGGERDADQHSHPSIAASGGDEGDEGLTCHP